MLTLELLSFYELGKRIVQFHNELHIQVHLHLSYNQLHHHKPMISVTKLQFYCFDNLHQKFSYQYTSSIFTSIFIWSTSSCTIFSNLTTIFLIFTTITVLFTITSPSVWYTSTIIASILKIIKLLLRF